MKVSIEVDAIQWTKDGDHPRVTPAGPTLCRRGDAAYISGMWPFASAWLEFEPLRERPELPKGGIFEPMVMEFQNAAGERHWRRAWPFNFWKLKGNSEERPIEVTDDFYLDCMAFERAFGVARGKEVVEAVPHGWLNPPASDGRKAVFPGDWIVTIGSTVTILSNDDMKARYPAATEGR